MSVLATSTLVTEARKKINLEVLEGSKFQQVSYIHYLAKFGKFSIEILMDSSSNINTMQPSFTRKLGFCICNTNVGTQKIDGSRLESIKMVIGLF